MKVKKYLRLVILLLFIMVATVVPVPIRFYTKDKLPSYKVEQVDKKDEEKDDKEYREIT